MLFAPLIATAWNLYRIIAAIFAVVDVVLVVWFVCVFLEAWKFHPNYESERHHGAPVPAQPVFDPFLKERWNAVAAKFALKTPESARIAIIEADALVDTALKRMQIPGEHLADRLSNLEADEIPSMTRVWRAHRLRNDLVHTPGFTISLADVERTMKDYEAFLKDIKAVE